MKTAHLTTATRPAITSTAGALSDRELLRETRNLVRHERHLQGAIIDHLAEIEARGLYLQRGFSSLFDYAVRELGYSRLADAERRRGAAVGVRPAAAPRVDLRHRCDRTGGVGGGGDAGGGVGGTERSGGRLRAGRTVAPRRAAAAAAGARCGGAAEARGRGGWQERTAGPPDAGRPGPGAGAAGRPGASARRRPLRAEGDYRRAVPAGAGATPRAALTRGPAHDDGTARRPPGAGGARPPRPEPATAPSAQRQSARGREGTRPANSDAGAGATEQRSGGEARRASGGHRGGAEDRPGRRPPRRFDAGVAAGCAATRRFDDEGRGDPRRRRSHTGAGGSPDTDQVDGRRHSGGEVMRFGPRDFGGCQTTGVATRRRGLQLRRSTDRAPLQLNASDRDRPHRSWEPQTVWRPSPPPARAWQVTA